MYIGFYLLLVCLIDWWKSERSATCISAFRSFDPGEATSTTLHPSPHLTLTGRGRSISLRRAPWAPAWLASLRAPRAPRALAARHAPHSKVNTEERRRPDGCSAAACRQTRSCGPGLSHGRGRGGLAIGRRGRPGPAQRHHPVVSGRRLPAGRVSRSGLRGWGSAPGP